MNQQAEHHWLDQLIVGRPDADQIARAVFMSVPVRKLIEEGLRRAGDAQADAADTAAEVRQSLLAGLREPADPGVPTRQTPGA